MNIDEKLSTKYKQPNELKHIKKITQQIKQDSSLWCRDGSANKLINVTHSINGIKDNNHMTTLVDAEKASDKV